MDNDVTRINTLVNVYSKMNDKDKEMFLFLLDSKRYANIIALLDNQDNEVRQILENNKRHNFAYDFAANIAGNIVTDVFFGIVTKLFKK